MTQDPIQSRAHNARHRQSIHQSWSLPSTKSRISAVLGIATGQPRQE